MRIAIIGTGISGNLVARLSADEHQVTVFEANDYVGGHSNTVDVELAGERYSVDTGFMVFNERTYPNFCRMLENLNVPAQDSDMSFSVRCDRTGLEYQGSSLNGLFAQRSNVVRPSFYGMIRDILRFNRHALDVLDDDNEQRTLGEYLDDNRYSRTFIDNYLVPMGAAIWSARPRQFLDFPVQFLIGFFRNHGLLQLRDRPQWRTVSGGSREYVEALIAPFRDRVRLNCPVAAVWRHEDHVVVQPESGSAEIYDEVIFATHADQTLGMLQDADDLERQILSAFPYQSNEAILHTDTSLLPRRRRAWASWNYHIAREVESPVAVTYDLSRLQSVPSPEPILLTLNYSERIDAAKILRRFDYSHPAYGLDSIHAQRRRSEINGRHRTYFCGAYWGYGFHEDGVNSALAVARHFGKTIDQCTVASTKGSSSIGVTSR